MALEEGCQQVQQGEADFCLIGGVDSYLEPETLEWLDEGEQLHSTANTWGFIPGEAAGFCLLASQRAAERYQLKALAWVRAVATAMEPNLIKTDTVCTGQGLSVAFKEVLNTLPASERVNQTICDMNGERYRADEFAFTIARTSERFVDATDFTSPADCWGDVGAASGPLFINLVSAAALKGYAKGSFTMLWTSSESGQRSAAVIYAEVSERI
jgi:3-oxoacyl-[acyl-carrier-protein] synthase-1